MLSYINFETKAKGLYLQANLAKMQHDTGFLGAAMPRRGPTSSLTTPGPGWEGPSPWLSLPADLAGVQNSDVGFPSRRARNLPPSMEQPEMQSFPETWQSSCAQAPCHDPRHPFHIQAPKVDNM
jgi:hypothetical protein